MNTIQRLFLLLSAFVFSLAVSSQSITIQGELSSNKEKLPFVSITVSGTNLGTTSDLDGRFRLDGLQENDELVFSFIGYTTKKIRIIDDTFLKVELEPETEQLEEVVITALGIVRQERKVGYSTEKVDAQTIEQSAAPNIISAMSGRAAGVQISNSDGVDGGSSRIVIRGNNNISENNQPLIVIDGVMMDNNQRVYEGESSTSSIGRGQDWGSALNNINPYDIETYNVLKGGAASALYGSRGANGVIEITTKKGKSQKGIGVSYTFSHKVSQAFRFRDVQNKYGAGGPISFTPAGFPVDEDGVELYPGVYGNDNLILNQDGASSSTAAEFGYYGSAVSWGPEMDGRLVRWWDGEMRPYSPQPDNISMFYRTGSTTTHNLAASGGNDKGTVRLSVTRNDHTPIIDNSNYAQTTVNLGSSIFVSDRVKINIATTYTDFSRLNTPILGEDPGSFSKGILYSWPRSYQGIDMANFQLPDGSRNQQENYPFFYVNPYLWWNFNNHNQWLDRNKFIASVALDYQINDWLKFNARSGLDFNLDRLTARHKPVNLFGIEEGYYSSSLFRDQSENHDFIFTAEKNSLFGDNLNVEFSVGGARWDKDYYGIQGNSGRWYYPNMYTMFNYTPYDIQNGQVVQTGNFYEVNESIIRRRTNSVYSFINFDYRDYLFVQLTGRNDWSSTLPAESNSYFYPSVSLSFIPSQAFSWDLGAMNFLKIRGGAAQTATDAEPYQTNFYYQTSFFAGNQVSSFPNAIPPIGLKPQRVNSYELGTNIGWYDNKLELDFTYYYMHSFDQIIRAPVPSSSGADFVYINEGVISNQGIEIILNAAPIHTRNITLKTGVNFSRNRNHVISLGDYADEYLMAEIWGLNGPAMILRAGDEFGTIYGYDHVYHDNGQAILNDAGTHYQITDNRVPIGNAAPDFIAGWNTSFRYKNFNLGMLIDTKWGGDIYAGSYVIGLQTGQSPETLIEREGGGLPYTDPDGTTSNIGVILPGVYADGTPNEQVVHYYYKYLPNAGGWGHFLSTPGIIENTWVKMRELSLSYTLPPGKYNRLDFFKNLQVSLVGRDLFYFYTTLPDNINPEGLSGVGNAQGFEWASYPSVRSIIFRVQANF